MYKYALATNPYTANTFSDRAAIAEDA